MKELLKKLLALFKVSAPNKPVEVQVPEFLKVVEPAPKRKPGRPKKTEVFPVKEQKVKKTGKKVAKKTAKKAK